MCVSQWSIVHATGVTALLQRHETDLYGCVDVSIIRDVDEMNKNMYAAREAGRGVIYHDYTVYTVIEGRGGGALGRSLAIASH